MGGPGFEKKKGGGGKVINKKINQGLACNLADEIFSTQFNLVMCT